MDDVHDAPNADDEYARFESFARKVVNTPKPKPKDELRPPGGPGEPADDDPDRERR